MEKLKALDTFENPTFQTKIKFSMKEDTADTLNICHELL